MKRILPALIFILLFGCTKNADTTNPVNTAPTDTLPGNTSGTGDTLAPGWTKVNKGFSDIYFSSDLIGYGIGTGSLCKTTDGGETWSPIYTTADYFNISGTADGKIFLTGYNSRVLYSTDAGASFNFTQFFTSGTLWDSYFPGNNNGYLIATDSLYRTTDGGNTWNGIQPYTGIPHIDGYHSLFFINDSIGWIIAGLNIYRTSSSVSNWLPAVLNGGQATDIFTALYATSANVIYAVTRSGQLFKSTDGGMNFALIKTFTAGTFADIHFVNSNTGYVSLDKKIYKTTDGGTTWQTVVSLATDLFSELHFIDANHGWGCALGANATDYGSLLIYRL